MTKPTVFQLAVCVLVFSVLSWYADSVPTADDYIRAVVAAYLEQ